LGISLQVCGLLLRPNVPTCEKCIYEACPYWDCLDQITVEEVAMSVEEALERLLRDIQRICEQVARKVKV